ncbi:MAG: peptidoglycan DD-metalloendopeptidase family protein, partial [Acidimicrobiales bacterium]|nr:peptidoglycan DD-metalloendopeptidase family protein [Acidimicrobiales bacterium]
MRRLALVLATLVALCAAPPARAGAPAAVTYRPPVDAPVVDPFRPADPNWTAGNRGLEYATTPGSAVAASAAGEVVFAGPVGDGLHVVVLHDDGLRTSYSFLQLLAVKRGDKVTQGQTVGTAQARFHFGARAGDAYLDPALLFGGGPPQVHLVPDELRRPLSEAKEREGLARMFAGWGARAIAAGGAAFEWARDRAAQEVLDRVDELRGVALLGHEGQPLTHVGRFAAAAKDWWMARETCTADSVPTPRLEERRVAVMVAGLGSKSTGDSIDAVDTAALGYAEPDVFRFSYMGGTREEHPYAATDTTADIHQSAKHLRELLERIAAERPGVPIDIIAHSQGGIVARTALTDEVDGHDPRLPQVKSLVTLSTPHQGAPIATLATVAGHTKIGGQVQTALHDALPDMVDPQGTSVKQLAEQSFFMLQLNMRPMPAGLNVTSIGAREDWMVPAGVTHLDGAHNVIVSAPGYKTEHSDMPGAPETQREIALGLAGMAPTCQGFGDFVADFVVSDYIRAAENAAAAGAYIAGRRLDKG